MSEIDIQNAKQIRDPMDVLITMSLADDDIDMTYSGYSSAKVADGVLDQSSWPMRKLADLQGDGFPLDGSCVLYNASTTPSQVNGKLGVRGNVGETVTVTATGDRTMASIGASVTGAESVTMNGTTTPITGTNVTLPLLDTTATLTFNPASETRRIEINTVLPEADFKITNENLIRATVSLRSDLSIIGPTLPESEINIEAYFDEDVSEAVAAIPEDTPIKYQAGYPGDMSPERKFYVTGQVTWADNVLSIQGVDAVHFLDVPQETLAVDGIGYYNTQNSTLDNALLAANTFLTEAGVNATFIRRVGFYFGEADEVTRARSLFESGRTFRDIIAQFMQLMHIDNIPEAYFSSTRKGSFWFNYVDAGIPVLSGDIKPGPKWVIEEENCGDIKKNAEPKVARIIVNNKDYTPGGITNPNDDILQSRLEVGTIDWIKGQGAFVKLDDGAYRIAYGLGRADGVEPIYSSDYVLPIVPADSNGSPDEIAPDIGSWYGMIFSDNTQQKYYEDRRTTLYTQVVPWGSIYGNYAQFRWRSQAAAWDALVSLGIIDRDAETFQLKVFGNLAILSENQTVYDSGTLGSTAEIQNGWIGRLAFCTSHVTPAVENAMPDYGYRSLFDKSPITGSFTWKGDPRMQPRDVVEWERLDGTTTTITLENITLTHEGGGTMAEITYREGVV